MPIVVVSNVLISSQGELLMGLRGDLLQWELPGGLVGDEEVAEAARREQEGRTGMELLGVPQSLGYLDWKYRGKRHVSIFLSWSGWSGFPVKLGDETLQWRWFPVEELPPPERCTVPTRLFVEKILPFLLRPRAA